ncbi:RCC1 domain-containing protein [Bdellovibrio bacteriovorus]|uniref:RTX family exoprotein n=1 Tax=Bdellovibrio bacteriovorus str. Tiberius TaxID=1069642 RepID=K7YWB2_BDEBC|nr:RTX family exoprotein [Bdellovibrio bacteriovorus]AFY01958.1 RTX family exoprotein [Bdellovibrio bacteriovorus str. Tiberius]
MTTNYIRNLLIAISFLLLTACSLDAEFFERMKSTDSGSSDVSFKLSDLPTDVPESFPYYGQVQVSGISSAMSVFSTMTLSLEDSTCAGLAISDEGWISGVIDKVSGETCDFKVKVIQGSYSAVSGVVSLGVQNSLQLTLSQENFSFDSGAPTQTTVLNLSAPAPFATYLDYSIYSANSESALFNGLNTGKILVPAGATSVSIPLTLQAGLSLSSAEHQTIQLNSGMSGLKPKIELAIPLELGAGAPAQVFQEIDAGDTHVCAITSGKLYCWGNNDKYRLGLGAGDQDNRTKPVRVGSSTTWQKVALSDEGTCGINDGKLYCWGRNDSGRSATGSTLPAEVTEPTQVGGNSDWQDLTGGAHFSCGIRSGELYCWGYNQFGQLATGDILTKYSPTRIGASTTWQKISAGASHVCGIDSGKLYCWGGGARKQLGNNASTTRQQTILQVGVSTTWEDVVGGSDHTCGINDGKLYCWGDNSDGELGLGEAEAGNIIGAISQVGSFGDWESLTGGGNHTCGIRNGGDLYCWGAVSYQDEVWEPTRIGSDSTWNKISTSYYMTCGINNGSVLCWAHEENTINYIGLGEDRAEIAHKPHRVGLSSTWSLPSAGYGHSCAINAGRLYCWGDNSTFQLGQNDNGSLTSTIVPQQVGNSKAWQKIASGGPHTCGIKEGELYCWGLNVGFDFGGGGPPPPPPPPGGGGFMPMSVSPLSQIPARVGSSKAWTAIAAGSGQLCGINGGKMYCWGQNSDGQMAADPATVPLVEEPTQVSTSDKWHAVGISSYHSCGIDDGKLYCWGYGDDGELGDGNNTSSHTPVRVGSDSDWTAVVAGNLHTCGIRSGQLYCWGGSYQGALGTGSMVDASTPQRVGVSSSWTEIASGFENSAVCGIDGGKLFCWGSDGWGQQGNGSAFTGAEVVPIQLGTSANWQKVSIGERNVCAVNAGKLFCWGGNNNGQSALPPTPGAADPTTPTLITGF